MIMADLFLHEPRIPAILDQMRDIRAAQRMKVQHRIQAELVAVLGQPLVQMLHTDPHPRSDGHAAGLPSGLIAGRTSVNH